MKQIIASVFLIMKQIIASVFFNTNDRKIGGKIIWKSEKWWENNTKQKCYGFFNI